MNMTTADQEQFGLTLDGLIRKTKSQQIIIQDLDQEVLYLKEMLMAQQGMLKDAITYIRELEVKVPLSP